MVTATKYSALPAPHERRAAPGPKRAVPILKRPIWQDVDAAAAQIHQMNVEDSRARCGLNIYIAPPKVMSHGDWKWKELREGGCLHRYLNIKRHQTRDRWEMAGKFRHGFRQNSKSDLQLMATIPMYDYFRLLKLDPFFFRDFGNLRSLKRDNDHVTSVYV